MTTPAPPPDAAPPDARRFPREDDLCESCGYPLKGLNPDGDCPECGSAVDASHPRHRTARPGYCNMFLSIARRPKPTFRGMRLDGSSNSARMFLLINAVMAATLFVAFMVGPLSLAQQGLQFIVDPEGIDVHRIASVIFAWPCILVAVPILTYIEILGVTWFSRKRGWRVPLRHAERVACYASVGWLPGAVVLGFVMNLGRGHMIEGLWAMLGGNPVYGPDAAWGTIFLTAVVAMLGFETLVWIGVRQVRFANRRPAASIRLGGSENAACDRPA